MSVTDRIYQFTNCSQLDHAGLTVSRYLSRKIPKGAVDLSDGRHLFYVISDNYLNPSLATQILAGIFEPTGQVKKALQ